MTMSMSFALTTSNASEWIFAFPCVIFLALETAWSATRVMRMARPARRWISLALRLSTSHVPPPTVPMPNSPTLIGFIFFQSELEVLAHARPLVFEHAVHNGVAHAAVAPRPVMADDAILLRAKRLDGSLRAEVEVVGAQANNLAVHGFEAVHKKQKLAGSVDMRALAALGVPRVADLYAVGGGNDVVVAGAADDRLGLEVPHRPRQHLALLLAFQRVFDVLLRLLGLRHRRKKQLPQPAIACRVDQPLFMLQGEGLETDSMSFELFRPDLDHAAPRSRPSFRNMSRMPRAAWRRRCSFSISAIRTWSSP